jgi:hypothetical protein
LRIFGDLRGAGKRDEAVRRDLLGARARIDARPGDGLCVKHAVQCVGECLAALAERGAHDVGEQRGIDVGPLRSARGSRRTTADSTFGGGRKASGGTCSSGSTRQASCSITESRP